jgi:hypothetical protein
MRKLLRRLIYRTERVQVRPKSTAFVLQPRPWARLLLRLPVNRLPPL